MHVPFVDLKAQYKNLKNEIERRIRKTKSRYNKKYSVYNEYSTHRK